MIRKEVDGCGFSNHPENMKRRVVISSIGIATSLGDEIDEVFERIEKKECGIHTIADEKVRRDDFPFAGIMDYVETRKMDIQGKNVLNRTNKLLAYSLLKALKMYGYEEGMFADNDAIYIGNQMQNVDEDVLKVVINNCIIEDRIDLSKIGAVLKKIPPSSGIKILTTTSSHTIGKHLEIHGEGNINYTGSTSGLSNLYLAYNQVASGRINRAIVCAANSPFSSYEYYCLCQEGRLRKSSVGEKESELLYPFDKKHCGTVYSEGSATFIVESEESALKNNRKILCYIEGGALNTFPGETYFSLESKGFEYTMKCACENSNLAFSDIDFAFTNANSIPEWDNEELKAMLQLSGNGKISLSNSKANLGDSGPVAALHDCALAVYSLQNEKYLSLKNDVEPDIIENSNIGTYFEAPEKYQYVLVNSAGVGGSYCSLILSRNGGASIEE